MKEHYCLVEKALITYKGECNWCGESEGSMTHKALIRRLEISCLGLDAVDPLRLLVDDVIAALAQHDSVQAKPEPEQEPVCPDCKAKVLYECVACSSNNYPPKTKQELCKYGQEPKSCTSSPMDCQCAIDAALAQPEQEPVVGITAIRTWFKDGRAVTQTLCNSWVDTTPPQRTFVGLTDEEYIHITDSVYHQGHGLVAYYKAIEAKLKEKNT